MNYSRKDVVICFLLFWDEPLSKVSIGDPSCLFLINCDSLHNSSISTLLSNIFYIKLPIHNEWLYKYWPLSTSLLPPLTTFSSKINSSIKSNIFCLKPSLPHWPAAQKHGSSSGWHILKDGPSQINKFERRSVWLQSYRWWLMMNTAAKLSMFYSYFYVK